MGKVEESVALLLGPPGSGKGARGEEVLRQARGMDIPLTLDVMSDLLRNGVPGVDQNWHEEHVLSFMRRAELVPTDTVLKLVRTRLDQVSGFYLLDGFPREIGQAEKVVEWSRDLARQSKPCRILVLNTPTDVCRTRILGPDGRRREDDTPENVERRMRDWFNLTMPGVEHLVCSGLDVSFIPPGANPTEGAGIILHHLLRD